MVQPYIPQAMDGIEGALKAHLDSPLQPGEVRQVIQIMNGGDGQLYILDAFVDGHDKVVRIENATPARTFLEQIIQSVITKQ